MGAGECVEPSRFVDERIDGMDQCRARVEVIGELEPVVSGLVNEEFPEPCFDETDAGRVSSVAMDDAE